MKCLATIDGYVWDQRKWNCQVSIDSGPIPIGTEMTLAEKSLEVGLAVGEFVRVKVNKEWAEGEVVDKMPDGNGESLLLHLVLWWW
jgi:hypothetical protein